LFEKFICEYFIKEHPGIRASSSQIPWALDDGVGTMLPVLQTDIMLSKKDNVLGVDRGTYNSSIGGQGYV
jgi:5-methylcytosine-specific restriction enzyme subunit McrC